MARLGFKIYLDLESLYPHLVTPVLFLGPLYGIYLGNYLPFQRYWNFQTSIVSRFFCWQGARNYLFVRFLLYLQLPHLPCYSVRRGLPCPVSFVYEGSARNNCASDFPTLKPVIFNSECLTKSSSQGPVTEELVFRACVLSVYHLSAAPKGRMILLCPLSFGLGTS